MEFVHGGGGGLTFFFSPWGLKTPWKPQISLIQESQPPFIRLRLQSFPHQIRLSLIPKNEALTKFYFSRRRHIF